ncbi:helix-turn-helix transcriptional regulator [Paenibacillus sp. MMS20-IR301]|uniref:helix-turn-helix transcriptional regulator n=1 Tax=Paenibacillus sp. MMS20-IR301 TaxID=2895946 RepID=UPI0028EFAB33|nr:helix-turn-helix transcriptional regulator [Paenibacillus sp. MMS20-IR301]WNS45991.1 helix-turn-helix transcriptional regulator [Paenibacillus sp. MMS20-IR301]
MNEVMKAIIQLDPGRAGSAIDSQQYREAVITKLRTVIPFAAACCTAVDPHTLLTTGAVTEQGLEAVHSELFEYEYLHGDYMKHEQLIQAEIPVACLSGVTGGQLEQSERYREVLQPAGFGDELRAALMAGGVCWGFLTLFRQSGSPLFGAGECTAIASIAPYIADGLRHYASSPPAEVWSMERQPEDNGIMVLNDRLIPVSTNTAANNWLEQLRRAERLEAGSLPGPVRAVALRVLAGEQVRAGLADDAGPASRAKVCLLTGDGAYLTVTASRLDGPDAALAVSFTSTRPSDIFRLLADAFALTARERELAGMLSLGLSTKELAESLHISPYTVQDHLKSIFAKAGVSSRRELIRRLLSQ